MDQDCVHFLQWALPKLDLRWPGFRKVRGQVCKRIKKRMQHLHISDWEAYRDYLYMHEGEWHHLDGLCRITISRFYRDYYLWDYLGQVVLPGIVKDFPDASSYRSISLGCASGEEPYTLAIIWNQLMAFGHPDKSLQILALDSDPALLDRARDGIYPSSSMRELPSAWQQNAFLQKNDHYVLKEEYKTMVSFIEADIRHFRFSGPLHLVLCRNLAATYFSDGLQLKFFRKIRKVMPGSAVLVLGSHEALPKGIEGFQRDDKVPQIYWAV